MKKSRGQGGKGVDEEWPWHESRLENETKVKQKLNISSWLLHYSRSKKTNRQQHVAQRFNGRKIHTKAGQLIWILVFIPAGIKI